MEDRPQEQVIPWPQRYVARPASADATYRNNISTKERLTAVLALVQAVESSQHLAMMPDDPVDKMNYEAALQLLRLAEREIIAIRELIS